MGQGLRSYRVDAVVAWAARAALCLEGVAFATAGIARQTSLVGIDDLLTIRIVSAAIAVTGATASFLLAVFWIRVPRGGRIVVGVVELAAITGFAGSWTTTRALIVVTAALVSALTLIVPLAPHVRARAR